MTAGRITMRFPFARNWALLLRYRADRQRLLEMDDHHLLDIGLRRGDLEHGVPFRQPERSVSVGFSRRKLLVARGWTFKELSLVVINCRIWRKSTVVSNETREQSP